MTAIISADCGASCLLYTSVKHIDPKNPSWEDRDWFVLYKGHGGPVMYATLGLKGYYPMESAYTLNPVSYTHLAKVTLEAIMAKLKADGYKSGYTTEIQDIRKVWEEERLRVLGVQYKGCLLYTSRCV